MECVFIIIFVLYIHKMLKSIKVLVLRMLRIKATQNTVSPAKILFKVKLAMSLQRGFYKIYDVVFFFCSFLD